MLKREIESMGQMLESIKSVIVGWKRRKMDRMLKFWIKKGIALDNDGRHQEAIASYDMVLGIDPQNPHAWSFKGGALLKLGKFREAKAAYMNFVRLAPSEYAQYVSEAKEIVRNIDVIIKKSKVGK